MCSASQDQVAISPNYDPPGAADKIAGPGNIIIDTINGAGYHNVTIHAVAAGHVTLFWTASNWTIE